MTRAIRDHAPTLLWAVVVAGLLLVPGDELTRRSHAWILDFVRAGGDKLLHLVAFLVLTFLLHRSLRLSARMRPEWRPLLLAMALAFLYSLCLELLQAAIPERGTEPADLLANALGCGLYAPLFLAGAKKRGGEV